MLNRDRTLKIFGPPGFLSNVQGKLAGYTWNLTAEYPFSVQATEVHPHRILSRVFQCQEGFAAGEEKEEAFNGVLEEDPQIRISATYLDHLIPCLAFSLQERFHINVHKERLDQMDLPLGPWLRELKNALWRGEEGSFLLKVPMKGEKGLRQRELSLEKLKECITITPGQKIVYVSDCRFSEENIGKIIQLAEGGDLFFCEAAFLEKDRERAEERAHLTARQAGELARKAKAKELIVFHFSPKYEKEAQSLYHEAAEAFRG
jgi:ribonuclease Z